MCRVLQRSRRYPAPGLVERIMMLAFALSIGAGLAFALFVFVVAVCLAHMAGLL
ncbi:hypothetical protein [Methylobacterium sp. WCS2018Hpa-22]|uniref:hypothetical protein n=1 Tax=Methylobacterium sp. WCS2018Hpa-22 TaxID=3073633 RepID=UPI00288A88B9|nr:hypothetical protein [Methylobacterium sp. WCS2018Hpa-22]